MLLAEVAIKFTKEVLVCFFAAFQKIREMSSNKAKRDCDTLQTD